MTDAEFDEALVLARGPLSHGGQRLLARALLRSIADRSALVLAERERCAKVATDMAVRCGEHTANVCESIAAAIRTGVAPPGKMPMPPPTWEMAQRLVDDERERCAKVAENANAEDATCAVLADAIRALK